jgi:excinuclease ABC subunit C
LYIGKAISLKKRVSSYFQNSKAHNQRITLMVSLINFIEYNTVKNEREALILEANLINNLQPKYNVALKDDKYFVYLEYTKSDPIPGFFVVRSKENTGSQYFGPFTNTRQLHEVMKIVRTIFPFCQQRYSRDKPCEYVSIKQCNGICCGKENIDEYVERTKQVLAIFNGKTSKAKEFIKELIKKSIESTNYELAGFYRDKLMILDNIGDKQKIVLKVNEDMDLLSLVYQTFEDGEIVGSFFIQQIRDGKIVNVFNSIISGASEDDKAINLLDKFLFSYTNRNGYNTPLLWSINQFVSE